jgi:hypothetical protein
MKAIPAPPLPEGTSGEVRWGVSHHLPPIKNLPHKIVSASEAIGVRSIFRSRYRETSYKGLLENASVEFHAHAFALF